MSPPTRRSSRRISNDAVVATADENKREENDEDDRPVVYPFQGVDYTSYQDMVKAKRQRNQQVLEEFGLLTAVQDAREASKKPNPQGLQKRKNAASSSSNDPSKRRKSNRLQGIQSDGLYIDEERAGHFTVVGTDGEKSNVIAETPRSTEPDFYRGRINDGAPLTLKDAVEFTGPKWVKEESAEQAVALVRDTLVPLLSSDAQKEESADVTDDSKPKTSPKSVRAKLGGSPGSQVLSNKALVEAIGALKVDDDACVAKVCPERIYSMAVHPSERQLLVCAGDKVGNVGIWNVDGGGGVADTTFANDGVHLFRPHRGAVSCLQWTASGCLFSASYDGTVRWFDAASEQFEEIFATYNEDAAYKKKLGFGLDTGSHFWTQYGCLDPRYSNEKCMFLSTSVGTAMHVDLRSKERITFHEELSEKKINTLSLHPNGYSLISGGLDCTVALWDLRKLGDSRTRNSRSKAPEPVAHYNGGRSVNSAFFSPSGRYVVSTTMANKLDVFENLHLGVDQGLGSSHKKQPTVVKPYKSIRHDNMTGRWLTTFQAIFHPQLDIFSVGSMSKPRRVEIFDPSATKTGGDGCLRAVAGDALTAVASRLAFHPRSDQLILVGGNSSGRVTILR